MEGYKRFGFPSCVFGWRGGKMRGWKTLLLVREKKERIENVVYIN